MPSPRPSGALGRAAWLRAASLLVVAILSAAVAAWALEDGGRRLLSSQLRSTARSAEHSLASQLAEREKEVDLLSQSHRLTQGALSKASVTELLEQRQAVSAEYAWLGLASPQGEVLGATGGLLAGQSVAQRPWFQAARNQFFVGDIHEAMLLEKLLKKTTASEPMRFIDIAAPVRDEQGQLRGVLGAHIHWRWVSDTVEAAVLPSGDRRQVELFITDRNGTVLYPREQSGEKTIPSTAWEQVPAQLSYWPDNKPYLTAYVGLRATPHSTLGWRILLRQPLSAAMTSVRKVQARILGLGALVGVAAALASLALAHRGIRRADAMPLQPKFDPQPAEST